jgi:dipeptidase E
VRTILALGGGGFTATPGDPSLDELVLQLAGAPVPRILFLPTASGDPRDQIGRFHAAFGDRPCEPEVLSLFRMGDLRRPLRDVAMCWLQGGVTTSSGAPQPTPGLGLLPGSLSVHADTEPGRRAVYLAAVADGTLPPGWIADDGVGLLFRDMALERVVSARPRARAARVDLVDGGVVETPIEPEVIAPAPRGVPADVRELRATRYGSRRD